MKINPYPLRVYAGSMTVEVRVHGMSCGHCVASIKSAVARVPGVTAVDVDLANGVVTVNGTHDEQAIAAAIEDTGYGVDRTPKTA